MKCHSVVKVVLAVKGPFALMVFFNSLYANANKIYFVSFYKNALDKSQWIHTLIVILVYKVGVFYIIF